MLPIEQVKERWRGLLSEFKELRDRFPVTARGVGLVVKIQRRNDVLTECRGMTREFTVLAAEAGALLSATPVSIDGPVEKRPADAWCSLLAQDRQTDFSGLVGTEIDADGKEHPVAYGTWTIGDAIGLSCVVAREILAHLESAIDRVVEVPAAAGSEVTESAPGVAPKSESGPSAEGSPIVWPPDDGWHFHSGKAAFRRVVFEVVGKPRLMLKRLADAPTAVPAVTWHELSEARVADGGDTVEQATIKDDIKELRKLLRRVFECPTDPIPNVERGGNCSWRLDCEAIRPRKPAGKP